jgi:hypothetical protein
MANRNLDNSKKITHLVGQIPCEQLENRPLTPAAQGKAVTASKSLQFFSQYGIGKI